MLSLWQYGGPNIDIGRLYKKSLETVAEALEIWANEVLVKAPLTWQPLFVVPESVSETGSYPRKGIATNRKGIMHHSIGPGHPIQLAPLLSDWGTPPPLKNLEAGGIHAPMTLKERWDRIDAEVANAIPIVASARLRLQLDPYQLSYGEEHVAMMRQNVAAELVSILSIPPEVVMCGEITQLHQEASWAKPQVVLEVAILHPSFGRARAESQIYHEDPFKQAIQFSKEHRSQEKRKKKGMKMDVSVVMSRKGIGSSMGERTPKASSKQSSRASTPLAKASTPGSLGQTPKASTPGGLGHSKSTPSILITANMMGKFSSYDYCPISTPVSYGTSPPSSAVEQDVINRMINSSQSQRGGRGVATRRAQELV
jgi:hypothetical protein